METLHSENGESPFAVTDDASIAAIAAMDDEPQYTLCPVEGCGEQLLWLEFESHLELHSAEQEQEPDSRCESSPAHKKIKLDPKVEASFDTKLSYALRNINDDDDSSSSSKSQPQPSRQDIAKDTWKTLLKMPEPQRASLSSSSESGTKSNSRRKLSVSGSSLLGSVHHEVLRMAKKSELGPHANEKQMPPWLVKLLEEKDGEITTINRIDGHGKTRKVKVCPNRSEDILPVLHQLLKQDKDVDYAYLCHPSVRHVSKLKREGTFLEKAFFANNLTYLGGFCGYRNIQMMTSYIVGVHSQGHRALKDRIPSIFEIQEHIETAWDLGINPQGRTETGGIRGTRKYIGTPDASQILISHPHSKSNESLGTSNVLEIGNSVREP